MILSERAAIMEEAIHKVQPGDTVTVVVRNLVPYGAFVTVKDPVSGDLTGGHVSCASLLSCYQSITLGTAVHHVAGVAR